MGQDNQIAIIELPTFTNKIYHLPKKMVADHRYPNEANDAFIKLNRKAFEFLNIEAYSQEGSLHLISHNFVGTIPIRMPGGGRGKPVTDLVIKPRYGDLHEQADWFEWMSGLAEFSKFKLDPERKQQLKLTRTAGTSTPRYLLARELINCFLVVVQKGHWNQFINRKLLVGRPIGNVDWNEYAKRNSDPHQALIFPTRINTMTSNHVDFQRAMILFMEAKSVIEDRGTPNSVRQSVHTILLQLTKLLPASTKSFVYKTDLFQTAPQDAQEVRRLKEALNAFLLNKEEQKYAWRIDFSKLFEEYIQQLISHVVAISENNKRIPRSLIPGYGHRVSRLTPQYLEPDLVAKFAGEKMILDSKYKSYFYSRNKETVQDQRQRTRSDIHQIIAYTSLENSRIAIILAPVEGTKVSEELMCYGDIFVGILGIPLQYKNAKLYVEVVRSYFRKIVSQLE
ncbi:restriction endonuclease [Pediococcus parvulus]|uniref:5-methylcytosine restriction system specificity protein McrC n=1 Tax=Pediococcus parvulus TaxID=54062 RepID=UPI0021A7FF52|nr:restriction endonuclease [Pediococcus parvulus]MCT3032079.1 restriction endonuclease [Pediococcus parvulus]MCT3035057.1 restriction endonuclease [Pediococcus parvulus]